MKMIKSLGQKAGYLAIGAVMALSTANCALFMMSFHSIEFLNLPNIHFLFDSQLFLVLLVFFNLSQHN